MESRNVKVIDEHGIDRDANIICGFIFDGSKNVLYSIGRDEESDNLFVSQVVDNLDGTSNMVNIETGKEKINEIVKELVTYSINNESDKTTDEVVLPSGNKVKITDVLFNKEQNINVTKTYVSTVKKSVTKVSEDFYKVDKQNESLEKATVFETLPSEEIVKEPEMVMPEISAIEAEPVKEEPVVLTEPEVVPESPVALESEEVKEPEIEPIPVVEAAPEPVPTVPLEEPEPQTEASTFVAPPTEQDQNAELQPELEIPQTLSEPPIIMGNPKADAVENKVLEEPTPISDQKIEPINPASPRNYIPGFAPNPEPVQEEPKLFFDGTNESNLNKALGEVSEEKAVSAPQEGVESLREFGVDEPATPAQEAPVSEDVKKLTRSKGFANNKFFMVIAIAFFLAACVFLGYEAFQYFTLK